MSGVVCGGANGSLTTEDTAYCSAFAFATKPAVDVSEASPVAKKSHLRFLLHCYSDIGIG